jgi:4-hydroxybenzoyl-CoA thioesterase
MLINRRKIYIEFGDCDPGGIVYFPRYLEYCDACTNALFLRAGLAKPKMLKTYGIAGIPLVEVRARFVIPSAFGDTVVAESCVVKWGRSSFSVRHRIFRGRVLAAEIVETRVWVTRAKDGPARFKPQAVPDEVKQKLSGSSRDRRK